MSRIHDNEDDWCCADAPNCGCGDAPSPAEPQYCYVILTRMPGVDTDSVIATSFEIAEAWCRNILTEKFLGKALIVTKKIAGITAVYADGVEMFDIMAHEMISR